MSGLLKTRPFSGTERTFAAVVGGALPVPFIRDVIIRDTDAVYKRMDDGDWVITGPMDQFSAVIEQFRSVSRTPKNEGLPRIAAYRQATDPAGSNARVSVTGSLSLADLLTAISGTGFLVRLVYTDGFVLAGTVDELSTVVDRLDALAQADRLPVIPLAAWEWNPNDLRGREAVARLAERHQANGRVAEGWTGGNEDRGGADLSYSTAQALIEHNDLQDRLVALHDHYAALGASEPVTAGDVVGRIAAVLTGNDPVADSDFPAAS